MALESWGQAPSKNSEATASSGRASLAKRLMQHTSRVACTLPLPQFPKCQTETPVLQRQSWASPHALQCGGEISARGFPSASLHTRLGKPGSWGS